MFKTIKDYLRIQRVLKQIYVGEKIPENLSRIFGVECHVDWIGRLYMVINPILQNIQDDGNTMIYDHNDKQMVEAWVMKNLELSRNFIINNQMFDILTYSIEKLDDDENYLVVFKNILWDDFKHILKISGWILGIGMIVGILLLIAL